MLHFIISLFEQSVEITIVIKTMSGITEINLSVRGVIFIVTPLAFMYAVKTARDIIFKKYETESSPKCDRSSGFFGFKNGSGKQRDSASKHCYNTGTTDNTNDDEFGSFKILSDYNGNDN